MQNEDGASELLKGLSELYLKGVAWWLMRKQVIFSAATALYKLDIFRSLGRLVPCRLDLVCEN